MGLRSDTCVFLLLGLVLSLIVGCGHLVYSSGPYSGQVVDAETKQPIAGAAVIAIWMRETSIGMVAEGDWDCYETLSEANGEFSIPRQTHFTLLGRILDPKLVVYYPAYAPNGIAELQSEAPAIVPLKHLTTREARISNAGRPIGTLALPWEKVPSLMRLINEELKQLGLQPYRRLGSQP